jgi:putative ABC transport system ATP-binding protein
MADEPTGNLDNASGVEVAELMFRLNRENGTTLVLVTHDATLATRCRRRLALAGGRLVGDETVAETSVGSAIGPAVERSVEK